MNETIRSLWLLRIDAILQSAITFAGSLSLLVLERLFAICLDLDRDEVRSAFSDDGTLFRTGILWVDMNDRYDFNSKIELLLGLADELYRPHEDPLELFRNNLIVTEAAFNRITLPSPYQGYTCS